jgi:pyrrolidone-carboxylate peptidase
MRLLIYGFGPYRHFQDNVTEQIVRRLPRRDGRKKIVFPVRFHKGQFLNAIKRHRPDLVLGLGQCAHGERLRIEVQAVNRRRNSPDDKARPILTGGPPSLKTNLRLALGRQGRSSNKAGEYVCNYSMYIILDFIKRHRLPIQFGFIHVPHRYDYRKAMRLVERAIGEIETVA